MITTLEEKQVVGRKDHSCGLCLRVIKKGELHDTWRNVDGRDIWTWRQHIACTRALPAFLKSQGIEAHWLEDYDNVCDSEFRQFMEDNDPDLANLSMKYCANVRICAEIGEGCMCSKAERLAQRDRMDKSEDA